MIVICEKCGMRYDDEIKYTFCPHNPLGTPRPEIEGYRSGFCQEHDLFNCPYHEEESGR
jgi:hypothetical protein